MFEVTNRRHEECVECELTFGPGELFVLEDFLDGGDMYVCEDCVRDMGRGEEVGLDRCGQ